jgi:hypothetical protein
MVSQFFPPSLETYTLFPKEDAVISFGFFGYFHGILDEFIRQRSLPNENPHIQTESF